MEVAREAYFSEAGSRYLSLALLDKSLLRPKGVSAVDRRPAVARCPCENCDLYGVAQRDDCGAGAGKGGAAAVCKGGIVIPHWGLGRGARRGFGARLQLGARAGIWYKGQATVLRSGRAFCNAKSD